MINVLDRFLLKRFLGPLVVTFFITIFVLVMQFLWKYIDNLAGKGIGYGVLAEFLFYSSATLVPTALPLAILLASIMTFGNLGEHLELTAIKSSGISLFRFMRVLVVTVLFLSVLAFYFSNRILPLANLKLEALKRAIIEKKPSLSFQEGLFNNDIDGYSIRVGRKHEDGQRVYNILIYDHSAGNGNLQVLHADSGRMFNDSSGRVLTLHLYDGYRYEEESAFPKPEGTEAHSKTSFSFLETKLDLSSFAFEKDDEERYSRMHRMLTLNQLTSRRDSTINSIARQYKLADRALGAQIPMLLTPEDTSLHPVLANTQAHSLQEAFNSLDKQQQLQVYDLAEIKSRNMMNTYQNVHLTSKAKGKSIIQADVEIYRKFTLSIACIVLFFIGAPLGSIIRKGGFGWPLVWAIIFFVIYYILSIIGEKMAEEEKIHALWGMWLSTIVLLPFGIFLTIQAKNDASLRLSETYYQLANRLSKLFLKGKSK